MKRLLAIGIVCLFLLVMCLIVVTSPKAHDFTEPWYGRGQDLPKLPYNVIVGPVDAEKGIDGVLEIGMSKSKLRSILGHPLVSALSNEEALKILLDHPSDEETGASLDISSFKSEFYGGVFAWVYYDEKERVSSIHFDPGSFNKKLYGKQKIVISCDGNTVVVDNHTSQAALVRSLEKARPQVNFTTEGQNTIKLTNTHLSFVFSPRNSKLRYVKIKGANKVM